MTENGAVTQYEYDLLGRSVKTTTPDGATELEYDALGNLIASTDALGNTTTYEYDSVGCLIAVVLADGSRVEMEYDLAGNLITQTDAVGALTQYGYDAAGRLTSVTDALGSTTKYAYDAKDNITAVTDALGRVTEYEWSTGGDLLSETDALGNTVKYEYTPEGWLSAMTKADGKTVSYTYDKNGQLLKTDYAGESVITNEYNALGRLTVTTGAEGRTEYQYDDNDRLISVCYPSGDVVKYSYDAAGNRTLLVYPDGSAVSYAYDSMNRMKSVTGIDGTVTEYSYDTLGRRVETKSEDISTTYEYDEVGNIVSQITTGETDLSLTYTYNANGSILTETREENGESVVSEYAYDLLGRVTTFENGKYSEAYTYDAVGNMLEKVTNSATIAMSYNDGDQMVSMSSANGTINYSYDSNGNMTSKKLGSAKDEYLYDSQDNLIGYRGYDGYSQTYKYSATGMMYEKTSSGSADRVQLEDAVTQGAELPSVSKPSEDGDSDEDDHQQTTRYTYDALATFYQVLTETTGDSTTTYEYGIERIAAYTDITDAESVKTQYVYDVGGSVIQTLASEYSENIAELTSVPEVTSYAYTPYGEQIGDIVSGYTYNAEYYDAATGMLNLRARQYEPGMMRFAQKDLERGSVLEPISLNRYLYCQDNPLDYSDPSGLTVWSKIKSAAKSVVKTAVATTVKAAASAVSTAAKVTSAVSKGVSAVSKVVTKASTAVSNVAAKVAASSSSPTLKKLASSVSKSAAKVSKAATTVSKVADKVSTAATKVAQKADAITKMSTDQIVSSVKSVATSVVKTVATTVKSAVNTVVSCTKKVANAVSTFYNEHSELIHTALDVVGMIPCLGDVCDAVNAGLYLLEGDYANAAMSAISFIPMAGALAAVGKIAGKYGDNLARGILKYGDDVASAVASKSDEVIESVMECTDGIGRAVTDHVDEAVENAVKCVDGNCFVAGTLILTVNGLVPIEEIQPGDIVIATNEETGETTEKEVVRVFVNEAIELAHVWVNGEEIISTPGHRFYVPEKGWTSAINLRAGDILVLSNGEYVTVEKVEHELLETPVTIYNFEVADFHTYYVGEQSVLVHNDGCVKVTAIFEHNGQVFTDVNPTARTVTNSTTSIPAPQGQRGLTAVNRTLESAHAEIGAMGQSYFAGNRGGNAVLTVDGASICDYCRIDIKKMGQLLELDSLTVNELATGQQYTFFRSNNDFLNIGQGGKKWI